jgi:hypothetical protein
MRSVSVSALLASYWNNIGATKQVSRGIRAQAARISASRDNSAIDEGKSQSAKNSVAAPG